MHTVEDPKNPEKKKKIMFILLSQTFAENWNILLLIVKH